MDQIKDHLIAKAINDLRDIAVKYHNTQQLREQIASVVRPLLKPSPAVAVAYELACPSCGRGYGSVDDEVARLNVLLYAERSKTATAPRITEQDKQELIDSLKDCHSRLKLLVDSGRYKMLDARAEHRAAMILLKLDN